MQPRRSGWAAARRRQRPIYIGDKSYDLASLQAHSPHIISDHIRAMNAAALSNCLADSTFSTYDSGWKSWLYCADFYGDTFHTDCYLPCGRKLTIDECVSQLDLYIGYECGLRQIKPSSISDVYLSAIAKAFDIRGISNNFRLAANDPRTKTLLAGYTRMWAQKHPAHENIKIPFTLILALQAEQYLKSGALGVPSFVTCGSGIHAVLGIMRLTCALFFGIFFLLRKGEFLPKSCNARSQHRPLRRSDIRFLDEQQRVIPYHLVGHSRASWITITIIFSKTDQTGRGRIVTHHVDVLNPSQCIVQRMEAYYLFSRDWFGAQASDILFEVPGCPPLTSAVITHLMREVCRLLGLPYTKVSAHSLRYGGATTLAAAGFPEYIIAFYGGWSPTSKAMRTYIKPTNDIIRRVSQQMSRAQSSVAVLEHVNQLLATRVVAGL